MCCVNNLQALPGVLGAHSGLAILLFPISGKSFGPPMQADVGSLGVIWLLTGSPDGPAMPGSPCGPAGPFRGSTTVEALLSRGMLYLQSHRDLPYLRDRLLVLVLPAVTNTKQVNFLPPC